MTTTPVSHNPGAVVLLAYRPDPDLFRIQLQSIQGQSRTDFTVLVAADGDQTSVGALVEDAVGDDPRFRIVGFPENVGFYRNAERALATIPHEVGWVALSDQDDRWHLDKLEHLVPRLDAVDLVSGQARVVRWPMGEVVHERTSRQQVSPSDLLFENQVSGALSVFRRDLMDLASPFPSMAVPSRFHDHWIAMCAAVRAGYQVVDEVVQDYVQHDANVVGEAPTTRRRNPLETMGRMKRLADEYEGGHSVVRCARIMQRSSFGWRREIVSTLAARAPRLPDDMTRTAADLDLASGPLGVLRLLRRARSSPSASPAILDGFLPGVPYEVFLRTFRKGSNTP